MNLWHKSYAALLSVNTSTAPETLCPKKEGDNGDHMEQLDAHSASATSSDSHDDIVMQC